MKTLILLALVVSGISQIALADQVVRSNLHKYTRYTTDGVKEYDVQRIKEANKRSEDDAITQAVSELKSRCSQMQVLDITNTKINPESITVGLDQEVSIQLMGICQDPKVRQF